jgi:membrane protease YdiL (CAAX protease family)
VAGVVRHRPDRNGAPASLTASASAPEDRGLSTLQLLLGTAAILALSLARATALRWGAIDIAPAAAFASLLLLGSLGLPSVRQRLRGLPENRSLVLGAALGAALLIPGLWMLLHGVVGPDAYLSSTFAVAWAPLVALIAIGEEVALRAWMQPLARQAWGPTAAIVFAAAVFAAIHAPIYGWVALPLDLGVGILIGCLREYTRSVAACALAHFIVDIGHWWLP